MTFLSRCFFTFFIFSLFSARLFADTISFTPPSTDFSVIFLGNVFGVVDGVLHGNGSQIFGVLFGVFNSSVIALGGIITMYTLLVSTMNTAHEGQFLGQKWSSIWVPVRSVAGIALLMPKASGYCMIQILVMWVCVQGIGAADKIWNAALDYLKRGGVIIQPQTKIDVGLPTDGSTAKGSTAVMIGAAAILEGQTCMLAIERFIKEARALAEEQAKKGNDLCALSHTPEMAVVVDAICNRPIPDFLATVENAINYGCPIDGKTGNCQVLMPQFDPLTQGPYADFNGACGRLVWNKFSIGDDSERLSAISLTSDDKEILDKTRLIAIQQLFNSVAVVSRKIVNNVTVNIQHIQPQDYYRTEIELKDQFGIPYNAEGKPCESNQDCVLWGPQTEGGTTVGKPVLFQGTELVGAISDYAAVMQPALRIQAEFAADSAKDYKNNSFARDFIAGAKQEGWLMAGSYFFRVALLNQLAFDQAPPPPEESGLEKSSGIEREQILKVFTDNWKMCGKPDGCEPLQTVLSIYNNANFKAASRDILDVMKTPQVVRGDLSNTIWGFVQNSMKLKQPGQPGLANEQFQMNVNFSITPDMPGMGNYEIGCGDSSFFVGCIVRVFIQIFVGFIFQVVIPNLMAIVMVLINQLIEGLVTLPMQLISNIFIASVTAIQDAKMNPIVALSNMGVLYINASMELWIYSMTMVIASSVIPFNIGPLIMFLAFMTPIVGTWMSIMVSVGFLTAYYVPFIPFMVFVFGVVGWLFAVIEAMVAAPIVALGVSSPEGDQALGKGEHAVMLLMNVFLRPGMMIIGFIAAISVSYVGTWILNAGFSNAAMLIQGQRSGNILEQIRGENVDPNKVKGQSGDDIMSASMEAPAVTISSLMSGKTPKHPSLRSHLSHGHNGWAAMFGVFFCIFIYTWLYWTIVQESFNLVSVLPDKILRWIGGTQETIGQETSRWAEQVKGKVEQAGKETQTAVDKGQTEGGQKIGKAVSEKLKGGGGKIGAK